MAMQVVKEVSIFIKLRAVVFEEPGLSRLEVVGHDGVDVLRVLPVRVQIVDVGRQNRRLVDLVKSCRDPRELLHNVLVAPH